MAAQSLAGPHPTSSPRRLFGVYLPEDGSSGYLLISRLSSGAFGTTSLVYSLDDGRIYVRKDEHVAFMQSEHRVQSPEQYRPLASTASMKTTTIWDFCNGGTLGTLARMISSDPTRFDLPDDIRPVIPEAFVWRLIDSMLDAIIAIWRRGISHNDFHSENIFLHWPSSTSTMPEVLIGDFGLSTPYPWSAHTNEKLNRPYMADDMRLVQAGAYGNFRIHELSAWYTSCRQDLWGLFGHAMELILQRVQPTASGIQTLLNAAANGDGMNEYSADLVQQLGHFHHVIHAESPNSTPLDFFRDVQDLGRRMHLFAARAETDFEHETRTRGTNILQWLRPALPDATPAVWTDRNSFIDRDYQNATISWVEPPTIWSVRLDYGQFEVRKVRFDDSTGMWELVDDDNDDDDYDDDDHDNYDDDDADNKNDGSDDADDDDDDDRWDKDDDSDDGDNDDDDQYQSADSVNWYDAVEVQPLDDLSLDHHHHHHRQDIASRLPPHIAAEQRRHKHPLHDWYLGYGDNDNDGYDADNDDDDDDGGGGDYGSVERIARTMKRLRMRVLVRDL